MRATQPAAPTLSRRSVLAGAFATLGAAALAEAREQPRREVPIASKDPLKVTKLETFLVKPRWLFLKVHTNAGLVGLGEPILEGRALTCAQAVKEIEPYLVGKDQALWDIKGKALGVPVYELLGGPTRRRVRVYAQARTLQAIKAGLARGFTAFKTNPAKRRPSRYLETPAEVRYAAEQFGELRKAVGDDADLAIDFHGAISPALAKVLIKALEPYSPMFIEEPVQCQNHDIMAEIARGTHLPIATGERVFTKWGFREVLEKKAAAILQPDLCHAGGITECRLIAGMAEAYYAAVAPHCPLGPIALAAGVQLAASVPNFLAQEQVTLGEGYLKKPFTLRKGYLDLPTGPGLGIELDEHALADKIDHDWKNREEYDADDGSVVDW